MEQYNRPVLFGFDVGISSAGWSVIDSETGHIVETGVRLFAGAAAAKNKERRDKRSARRLLRRRKNRIKELKYYLTQVFDIKDYKENPAFNPYEARVRGLDECLTIPELIASLLHIAKHRGISYDLGELENDTGANANDFKNGVNHNRELLKTQTPGQIQWERLETYGSVRGQIEIEKDGKTEILLNVFPTANYVDEAQRILKNQQKFYPQITDQVIENVSEFIQRKREYFVGPGNETNRTDYGIYREDGTTLDNLFEILIGKDPFYTDEYRAAGGSLTAQLFNMMNDLNNLRITSTEDQKLTMAHRKAIIQELLTTSKVTGGILQVISKVTGTPKDEIRGYRIDEKDKADIHMLSDYRSVRNKLMAHDIDISHWSRELYDKLAAIMTLNTEPDQIRKRITEDLLDHYDELTEDMIPIFVQHAKLFVSSSKQKWHRLSLKMMNTLLPEMYETGQEQSSILIARGLIKKEESVLKQNGEIDIEKVIENIYNPVVKKSTRELLKLFTALRKKYPILETVTIEMPRETNEKDAKKKIEKVQKTNKVIKNQSIEAFLNATNISKEVYYQKLKTTSQFDLKVRLWYEQEEKCPYSGKHIPAMELLAHPEVFEIDHIIPQSISFDDSLKNKVLCLATMNQLKAQQTPYQFMRDTHKGNQSFEAMQAMLKNNKIMPNKRKSQLLFQENVEDIEVRKRFINRNLVDTRYASRVLLNALQNMAYQTKDGEGRTFKVAVVRGRFTDSIRKKARLFKTRDTYHHHAIDASIIGASTKLNLWKLLDKDIIIPDFSSEEQVNVEPGEIIGDKAFKKEGFTFNFGEGTTQFLTDIQELQKEVDMTTEYQQIKRIKFSHQVDKKMNRRVSKDMIYSTRQAQLSKDKQEIDYIVAKIEDIYTIDGYKKFKEKYKEDENKFIMAQKDPKTFAKLKEILDHYPDYYENSKGKKEKISPFELYRRENGYVTKYSKKNNGPKVVSVKYYDKALGRCIDITPQNSRNKKVVLTKLNPWRTDVYYNNDKHCYELIGLSYSDARYINGKYGIPKSRYQEMKQEQGISDRSEFCFSLYKNDLVAIDDGNESIILRFLSKKMGEKKKKGNYVALKPIDKAKFDAKELLPVYGPMHTSGAFEKKLAEPNWKVQKVNVDILGNYHYLTKEEKKPKNIIDDK